MFDPIDLLRPTPCVPDAAHKRRVFEATLAELRRRRRMRLRALVGLGAGLAAAVLLLALLPVPHAERSQMSDASRPKYTSAEAIEWQALERPAAAKHLYIQAGDRYLDEGDPASAARSYGGALDAGTAADQTVSPEDNWLLMAIKLARQKESDR